ncbi:MAG: hypothetical protein ACI4V3_01400, partial [Faecousia sp.]
ADLSAIINKKNEADKQWKAQKQAERENASAMQDAAVVEVTQNPEMYARFLDMQGDNPTYSPGNVVMVMAQNLGFTKFGTAERWRSLGRNVIPSEAGRGANIFARQTFGRGYTLTPVYDITQTTGKNFVTPTLADGTEQMDMALTTLLNFSVVPVEVNGDLSVPARYNEREMMLSVNPNHSDRESFAAIAGEIAHSRFHAKGMNAGYTRVESELDAQSVAYLLCRRFGIAVEKPDMQNLAALYDGWTSQERRGALDQIANMGKQIGNAIAHRIDPPQKSRNVSRRAM